MKGRTAIFAAFLGAIAIITWRDFSNPDDNWPLPTPPPYRYVGAGVAFGMLALVAEFVNEKVPAVLAFGLLLGLGFQTATNRPVHKQPNVFSPKNSDQDIFNWLTGKGNLPSEGGGVVRQPRQRPPQ